MFSSDFKLLIHYYSNAFVSACKKVVNSFLTLDNVDKHLMSFFMIRLFNIIANALIYYVYFVALVILIDAL